MRSVLFHVARPDLAVPNGSTDPARARSVWDREIRLRRIEGRGLRRLSSEVELCEAEPGRICSGAVPPTPQSGRTTSGARRAPVVNMHGIKSQRSHSLGCLCACFCCSGVPRPTAGDGTQVDCAGRPQARQSAAGELAPWHGKEGNKKWRAG